MEDILELSKIGENGRNLSKNVESFLKYQESVILLRKSVNLHRRKRENLKELLSNSSQKYEIRPKRESMTSWAMTFTYNSLISMISAVVFIFLYQHTANKNQVSQKLPLRKIPGDSWSFLQKLSPNCLLSLPRNWYDPLYKSVASFRFGEIAAVSFSSRLRNAHARTQIYTCIRVGIDYTARVSRTVRNI